MCSRKIQMRYMICWSRDEERVGGVGQDGSDVRFSRGQLWPWGAGQKDGGGGNIPVESAIFDFFLPEFFLLQPRLRLDPTHTRTMAGDHKCPVCQATFTRPQHVARHMRSRTSFPPNPSHTPYPLLSPTLPHLLTNSSPHRYRRSPIQVSALWRSVRQKVRLSTLLLSYFLPLPPRSITSATRSLSPPP